MEGREKPVKLLLAICGAALAATLLIFSIAGSSAEPELPQIQPGPNARTSDEPERLPPGVVRPEEPHQTN